VGDNSTAARGMTGTLWTLRDSRAWKQMLLNTPAGMQTNVLMLMENEKKICGTPLGYKRNAEMKTHFTVLLCQVAKKSLSVASSESHSHDNVT